MEMRCMLCGHAEEIPIWHNRKEGGEGALYICDRCNSKVQQEARDLQKR